MNLIFLFGISFQKKQMFYPSLICKRYLIIMITNTNNKHVNELSQAMVDDTWKALEQASLGGNCY